MENNVPDGLPVEVSTGNDPMDVLTDCAVQSSGEANSRSEGRVRSISFTGDWLVLHGNWYDLALCVLVSFIPESWWGAIACSWVFMHQCSCFLLHQIYNTNFFSCKLLFYWNSNVIQVMNQQVWGCEKYVLQLAAKNHHLTLKNKDLLTTYCELLTDERWILKFNVHALSMCITLFCVMLPWEGGRDILLWWILLGDII